MGTIPATTYVKNVRYQLDENVDDASLILPGAGTRWLNSEILEAINKGKNKAFDVIRSVREDYFETTGASLSLNATTKEYTLATACRQIVGMKVTTSGYEYIQFRQVSQANSEFKVRDKVPLGGNTTLDDMIYDLIGSSTLKFANYPPVALTLSYDYIGILSDFTLSVSSTIDINDENREYIEGYALMLLFGKIPSDPRLAYWTNRVIGADGRGGQLEIDLRKRVSKRDISGSQYVETYDP